MDVLDHPMLLLFAILLSLLGSFYLWRSFRERNSPDLLIGIGLNIPTLGMSDWQMWAAGIAVCAVGIWLKKYLEG